MSAATFRRLGKIEQAKGAIQEGEVKDEDNPAVWVQLGLYYTALGHDRQAIDAFHKALFISPDDVSATVHLCRVYLSPSRTSNSSLADTAEAIDPDNVDLAAGMLSHAVDGAAWDVPEAWYFLAKAYRLQGRKYKEREALTLALSLSERRCVRDVGLAIGWCL
jgi:tetratricopeptide (TPR) repeat protein